MQLPDTLCSAAGGRESHSDACLGPSVQQHLLKKDCILCPQPETLNPYSPPYVDRIWGIWGSYKIPIYSIFYLLKGL